MKSPYKSKRFWAGVWVVIATIVSILPPEIKQPIMDYWNYASAQVPPDRLSYLGAAVLGIWGDDERVDWKSLIPRRKQ